MHYLPLRMYQRKNTCACPESRMQAHQRKSKSLKETSCPYEEETAWLQEENPYQLKWKHTAVVECISTVRRKWQLEENAFPWKNNKYLKRRVYNHRKTIHVFWTRMHFRLKGMYSCMNGLNAFGIICMSVRECIPVETECMLFKKAWQTQEATCPKEQIYEHTPGEGIHAR